VTHREPPGQVAPARRDAATRAFGIQFADETFLDGSLQRLTLESVPKNARKALNVEIVVDSGKKSCSR
jgi:hypothetical protein